MTPGKFTGFRCDGHDPMQERLIDQTLETAPMNLESERARLLALSDLHWRYYGDAPSEAWILHNTLGAERDMAALIRAQAAEIERLRKHLDHCLQWISSSAEAQDWNSRTTPDFVVAALAAIAAERKDGGS